MEQRFGYSVDELARRFDRSASWVSRRLALVEWLPEAIQQQVREGRIVTQVALKYLARSSTSNRQDSKLRGLTGFLGVLAPLRETLVPIH
jgi:hypothetical protein